MLDVATMELIHSLTHRTDAANVGSILENGLRPVGRTLHLSAFPTSHRLHKESSKDFCNVEIILKMQQTLMETAAEGMWLCGETRNIHLNVTVQPWLIWGMFLSYQEAGSGDARHWGKVCIYDCAQTVHAYSHTVSAESGEVDQAVYAISQKP